MNRYLGRIALLVLLSMCNIRQSIAHDGTATIVGRFIIKNPVHGQYKKNKQLFFSERFGKKYTRLIKTKDSSYFSMRLPLGYSYLEKIYYLDGGEFLKKFPSDYLEIKLDSPDRIYYIGDIVLTWDITIDEERPAAPGAGGGLIGGLIGSSIQRDREGRIPPNALPVSVTLIPETVVYFSKKMNTEEQKILTAPVRIKKKP